MTQVYEQAASHVIALTGSVDTPINWRCIHDTDKGIPAHNYFGTLSQVWDTLCSYNSQGWGIFLNVNAMDGKGNFLENVQYIRAHVVDLDNTVTSVASYEQAAASQPAPTFAVQTSPYKFHVYWVMEQYTGNEFYTIHQRKLAALYNGDKSIIDPTRVLRVAGFYHLKDPTKPQLVQCWELPGYGQQIHYNTIAATLANINVIEGFGSRHPLGSTEMAAPDLEWLFFGLALTDPNDIDRAEWISLTAAYKQAGWNLTDEATLLDNWLKWCAQYKENDPPENMKQWNSIRDTEVGWTSFKRRTPVQAYTQFGYKTPPVVTQTPVSQSQAVVTSEPTTQPQQAEQQPRQKPKFGEILSEQECKEYFKDCYFINRTGEIFSPEGRFMNATKFNGQYGGHHFIIAGTGKTTDEAWKAALRSTCWTIPKLDHVRFLPDRPTFEIIYDNLGRSGLNVYIPPIVKTKEGDISLFFDWFGKVLPDQNDQRIFIEYLVSCIKFKGFKIPWAPMLQSTEGIGKTIISELMSYALGDMYVYKPKAPELVKSGSTFNAWMRNKNLIVVDEIKIDERRELIEILKPMITDSRVEIQSKGVDQEMEDNVANWIFFSNYPDAIPTNKNGRRYAIFYSALQNKADMEKAGLNDEYFQRLWYWLRHGDGFAMITHYLMNYPLTLDQVPLRAPKTSSSEKAILNTRSPVEVIISDAITDGLVGFRGGFVSTIAALKVVKSSGTKSVTIRTIQSVLEHMGYLELGRAYRPYMQEDMNNKTIVYSITSDMRLEDFGRAQGYGD